MAAEAAALKPGQVLLLENLRFEKGETKNNEEFAASLASLADTYVNDAFGSAHRAHASVSGMVAHFPKDRVAAGFLMEKELKALGKVTDNPERPLVVIFGGAKVSDKIELIQNFLGKADAILIGGAMSYTFLKAQGFEIGKSLCEEDKLEMSLDLLKQAQAKGTRLLLPLDHLAATAFKEDADCAITVDQNIPADRMALDIGPETVAAYATEIRAAKTLLWNGPMGVFEMAPFASGTLTMAEELADAADQGRLRAGGWRRQRGRREQGRGRRPHEPCLHGRWRQPGIPQRSRTPGRHRPFQVGLPMRCVVANWKMNLASEEARAFCEDLLGRFTPEAGPKWGSLRRSPFCIW